jgi:hypothetical protein
LKNIVKYLHYENFDDKDSKQNDVSCEKESLDEAQKLERGC